MTVLTRLHGLRFGLAAWILAFLALALAVLAVSCGPSAIGPVKAPPKTHFVVIVHNKAPSGTDQVQVLWAIQGVYVGSQIHEIPAGGFGTFIMGEAGPDLVEIRSTALTTAWGPPDWAGHMIFHIDYPSGATWSE